MMPSPLTLASSLPVGIENEGGRDAAVAADLQGAVAGQRQGIAAAVLGGRPAGAFALDRLSAVVAPGGVEAVVPLTRKDTTSGASVVLKPRVEATPSAVAPP